MSCAKVEVVRVDVDTRELTVLHEAARPMIPHRRGPGSWYECGVYFNESGSRAYWHSAGFSNTFDWKTGKPIQERANDIWCTYLEVRGNKLLLCKLKNKASIHDAKSWRWQFQITNGGKHARLSGDGRFVASSGQTARSTVVWSTAKRAATCPPFGTKVKDLAFIEHTPYLITVNDEASPGAIRIWDIRAGRMAAPPIMIPDANYLGYLSVNRAGTFAAIGCSPHGIVVMDLRSWHENPLGDLSPEDVQLLSELNAGAKLDKGVLVGLTTNEWRQKSDDFRVRNPKF